MDSQTKRSSPNGIPKRMLVFAVLAVSAVLPTRPALGYVEVAYTLGRLVQESTHVALIAVEKVDKEKNIIIYRKVRDVKGTFAQTTIKHNIGRGGFHPREWQAIMNWAEVGKTAVFFHNGSASETYIDKYWYQAYPANDWWNMSHGEPFLLRTYAGKTDKLVQAVTDLMASKEVIVLCMEDGDKNALATASGRIQRMKANLSNMDYNPTRDFAGWGGDDFRLVHGMPAFRHIASITRVDPGAAGVAVNIATPEGAPEFCVFGEARTALLQVAGTSMNEISLPLSGGVRAAVWGDFNGDKRADLLLATSNGPQILSSLKDGFRNESAALPAALYHNSRNVAWIDADADGHIDIVAEDGFQGLQLLRNLGPAAHKQALRSDGPPWYYAGPFENAGGRGFDAVYPPELGVDLEARYTGKGGEPVIWREGKFADKAVQNLGPLFKPEHQNESCVYLFRELFVATSAELPVSIGSDDTLTVWLNGEKLYGENTPRQAGPDRAKLPLRLKAGRNQLLLKVCQSTGPFAFYFAAEKELPLGMNAQFADAPSLLPSEAKNPEIKQRGKQLVVADFDNDGRQDILRGAANWQLLRNSPQGFEATPLSAIKQGPEGVHVLAADVDADGALDILVVSASGIFVYRNSGKGSFEDALAAAQPFEPRLTDIAGATWGRLTAGGKMGLFVGRLRGSNRYFERDAKGQFVDVSEQLGLSQRVFSSRAMAIADLNQDGAPDLVLANEGQSSTVLLGASEKKLAAKP